jgi:hypothetical protein
MTEPATWLNWLSLAEWWYNTSWHSSIKMNPFKALYGIEPPMHLPHIPCSTDVAALEDWFKGGEYMITRFKQSLKRARNRMKQFPDFKRSERHFVLGDLAYLKLQPYVQSSLRLRTYSKLSQKYYGPFQVVKKVGSVVYTLDLPSSSQLHPSFHVSLLKRDFGPPDDPTVLPSSQDQVLQPLVIFRQEDG